MISLYRIPDRQYDNCVSLGWFCGTASSLSKLGLRGHSGPFDWYLSHYWAVLSQIENNFQDFMKKENLEAEPDNPLVFRDKKYGFHCKHDVKEDFEAEYAAIYEKYCRRADAFKRAIIHPTVFFRCIRDLEEVEYINKNWEYAEQLLKSFNKENRIIYIYRNGLDGVTEKVEAICLNIDQYVGKTYEMRHMFDNSEDLLNICERLIPVESMQRNADFDNVQNAQTITAAYVNKCIENNVDGIDGLILEAMGISKGDGMYLWGAGKFGIPLAQYLSKRDVVIKGILDNKSHGMQIEGFRIISFDEVENEARVFIAVSDKDANLAIEAQILTKYPATKIVKYIDLYGKILLDGTAARSYIEMG